MINIKESKNNVGNDCYNMSRENIEKVLTAYSREIKNYFGDKFVAMYLYGSCARGDYTEYSDIDTFILLNTVKEDIAEKLGEICNIKSDLNLENNVQVSTVIENKEFFEYWKNDNPLFVNVVKDGVPI